VPCREGGPECGAAAAAIKPNPATPLIAQNKIHETEYKTECKRMFDCNAEATPRQGRREIQVVRCALFAVIACFYVLVRTARHYLPFFRGRLTSSKCTGCASALPAKEFEEMSRLLVAAFMAAVAASPAYADEITVGQKNKAFSMGSATLKPGDTINFVNDDTTQHNVLITGPKEEIRNSGVQDPGEAAAFQFDKAGTYQVECGIHPKMKMSVVVK
jgi:plastocyanin